jgi:uncharacterized protein (TIGR02300 family)
VAKPELGSKRQCQNCGTKFFDLSKDPIVCPKCGTVFQTIAAAPARAAARAAPEDDTEAEPGNVELVSLEDADATDDKAATTTEEDIEIDDDGGTADETFLEEEEEGSDDVSDLIDGDIEDDEET